MSRQESRRHATAASQSVDPLTFQFASKLTFSAVSLTLAQCGLTVRTVEVSLVSVDEDADRGRVPSRPDSPSERPRG
jgi:hypothetical protein